MNNVRNFSRKYKISIKKYKMVGKTKILYTDNGTYCLKPKERKDINKVIDYLKTKQFNNILDFRSDDCDEYEITDYIEEIEVPKEEKAMEAIYLISMLHNKTTFYKNISLDEVKCFYEEHINKIKDIRNYIDNLCYMYDNNLFPSPSEYIFLRNVTLLYNSLDYSKHYINKWYEIMKNKSSRRIVMNHNNLDLSHLLIGKNPYLINWNNAILAPPVVDLCTFFKKNYQDINIQSLLGVYTSKYQLLQEEYFLLFALLLLPEKIELTEIEIENTRIIYNYYKYISLVLEFVSNYDLKCNK